MHAFRPRMVQTPRLGMVASPRQLLLAQVLRLDAARLFAFTEHAIRDNPALVRVSRHRESSVDQGLARPQSPEAVSLWERCASQDAPDLAAHLAAQLRLERATEAELTGAAWILGNLDARGFLEATLEDVAQHAGLTPYDVEDAQCLLMDLDPIGCGANDVAHYVQFYVRRTWPSNKPLRALVQHHLGDLMMGRLSRIADATGLSMEQIKEGRRVLASVPPYPVHGFGGGRAGSGRRRHPPGA